MTCHKSYASSMLKKQISNSRQALDRVAEESQLLPSYLMKSTQQRGSGTARDMFQSSADPEGITSQIKPWVMAADSAKIATLEAVAETIEAGQLALENCMKSIEDIDRFLGQETDQDNSHVELSGPSDDARPRSGGSARRQLDKRGPRQQTVDPWSRLHGNLGLISHDESD